MAWLNVLDPRLVRVAQQRVIDHRLVPAPVDVVGGLADAFDPKSAGCCGHERDGQRLAVLLALVGGGRVHEPAMVCLLTRVEPGVSPTHIE